MSGWTVFVGRMDLGDWRSLSKWSALRRNNWPALQRFSRQSGCECVVGDRFLRRRAPSCLDEDGPGGYLSLEQAVGWSTLGLQEEGLQGDDGSAALQEDLAGSVDQTRSGRRYECHGSWQLVRMESEDE